MTDRRNFLVGVVSLTASTIIPDQVISETLGSSEATTEAVSLITRPKGIPLTFFSLQTKLPTKMVSLSEGNYSLSPKIHELDEFPAFSINKVTLDAYENVDDLLDIVFDEADDFTQEEMGSQYAKYIVERVANIIARDTLRGQGNLIYFEDKTSIPYTSNIDFSDVRFTKPFYICYQSSSGLVQGFDGLIMKTISENNVLENVDPKMYYALHPEWKKYVKRIKLS